MSDNADKYLALAVKYSEMVDRYLALRDEFQSFKQSVLDPENQPSQYGTILLTEIEKCR